MSNENMNMEPFVGEELAEIMSEEDVQLLKRSRAHYPHIDTIMSNLSSLEKGTIPGLKFELNGKSVDEGYKVYNALSNYCKRHSENLTVRKNGQTICVVRKELVMQ